jgi:hypothetical protein
VVEIRTLHDRMLDPVRGLEPVMEAEAADDVTVNRPGQRSLIGGSERGGGGQSRPVRLSTPSIVKASEHLRRQGLTEPHR